MSLPDLHEGEIELRCENLLARVRRDLGGSVSGFWRLDATAPVPLLRSTANPQSPKDTALFPLLPFCNRIRHGRFTWRGRNVLLAPNDPDERHPLHGYGWRAEWQVRERTSEMVRLHWLHEPGEWPWRFEAEHDIRLSQSALELSLRLANVDSLPMPAGLGHHPYFPLTCTTDLTAEVEARIECDDEGIPVQSVAAKNSSPFSNGTPFGQPIDNTFTGWDGRAVLTQGDPPVSIELTAQPAPLALGIFIPPDGAFLCVEPVTHVPDALNNDIHPQMRELAPGERMELITRLTVS